MSAQVETIEQAKGKLELTNGHAAPKVLTKLNAAMVKVQAAMDAARKDSKNPAFGSSYADLASVRDAIKAVFAANGLGFRHEVKTNIAASSVSVRCIIFHESGEERAQAEWMELPVSGKKDAQAFGSAITYGRRYTLMDEAGVIPDDDGNSASGFVPTPAKAKPATNPPAPAEDPDGPEGESVPGAEAVYGPVIRFGRSQGLHASQLERKDLSWYVQAARKAIDDPTKANYKAKNEEYLADLLQVADSKGWRS